MKLRSAYSGAWNFRTPQSRYQMREVCSACSFQYTITSSFAFQYSVDYLERVFHCICLSLLGSIFSRNSSIYWQRVYIEAETQYKTLGLHNTLNLGPLSPCRMLSHPNHRREPN